MSIKSHNNPFFVYIDETNVNGVLGRPQSDNRVCFSSLKSVYFNKAIRNYSIKFALEGTEYYKINNKEYKVNAGHFLTAVSPSDGTGYFESKSPVKGICIDVDSNTLAEALASLTSNHIVSFENSFTSYLNSFDFFENVYNVHSHGIGKVISLLSQRITQFNDVSFLTDEWFLSFAEKIVMNEYRSYRKICSLSSVRFSTKKEILRCVLVGKTFMDDCYTQPLKVKDIARVCGLSEYYFFRCFKEIYKTTPYNYLLERRLNAARTLLHDKGNTVTEVAYELGFADLQSFSKAFKKHFGYSPASFRK